MTDRVWSELARQPLKAAPAWTKLTIGCDPIKPPERIGKTMRLRGEPPCTVCGNKSAWHCECEVDEQFNRETGASNKPPVSNSR